MAHPGFRSPALAYNSSFQRRVYGRRTVPCVAAHAHFTLSHSHSFLHPCYLSFILPLLLSLASVLAAAVLARYGSHRCCSRSLLLAQLLFSPATARAVAVRAVVAAGTRAATHCCCTRCFSSLLLLALLPPTAAPAAARCCCTRCCSLLLLALLLAHCCFNSPDSITSAPHHTVLAA